MNDTVKSYQSASSCFNQFMWLGGLCLVLIAALSSSASALSVPSGATSVPIYASIPTPIVHADPLQARPIGLGSGALELAVDTGSFSGLVDAYLALYVPTIDPANVYLITATGVQPLSSGLAPWKSSVNSVKESLFGSIPLSALPRGDYFFILLVVPAGTPFISLANNFFLWQTVLSVGNGTLSLGNLINDVEVFANQQNASSFAVDLPSTIPPVVSLTVDLAATLAAASIEALEKSISQGHPNGGATPKATPTLDMTIRVGAKDELSTVCSTGIPYGPIKINGTSSVSPQKVAVSQQTISVINTGAMSICILTTPSIDTSITVNSLALEAEACAVAPANIDGTWEGTYFCDNSGVCADEGGPITLTINQSANGYSAHYFDGAATYDGSVCGGTFRFNGKANDGSWTESGTFVVGPNGTATKTSQWQELDGSCGGKCQDTLTRAD